MSARAKAVTRPSTPPPAWAMTRTIPTRLSPARAIFTALSTNPPPARATKETT